MAPETKRYRAFISYSQMDKAWGKRLHTWLESYRVPVGVLADVADGRRLGRFFRDDEEMSAAADIKSAVQHSIENAESLIVICSPRSARSRWVEAEIRHFQRTGRAGRVFAFIIDGVPNSGDDSTECFPPALRKRVDETDPTAMPTEPVGIDVRKDGRLRSCARLAAGLLGIDFDDLWTRDRRRDAARLRVMVAALGATAGAFAVLAVIAVAEGSAAARNAERAIANEQRAIIGEESAKLQRDEAERQRMEADLARISESEQRGRADKNAEEARRQEHSARMREADARNALGSIFAERSWQALDRKDYQLAARYALAGWTYAPARAEEFRGALGRVLYDAHESTLVPTGLSAPAVADISDDAGRIAIAAEGGVIRILDRARDWEKTDLTTAGRFGCLSISGDGSKLVATHPSSAVAWLWSPGSAADEKPLRNAERAEVRCANLSGDGTRAVVTAHFQTATIFDTRTSEIIWSLPGAKLTLGHQSATLSFDGGKLVTVDSNGLSAARTAALWDVSSRAKIADIRGHEDGVTFAAFGPAPASMLVTGSWDGTAKLWDSSSGKERATMNLDAGGIVGARFNDAGSRLVTYSTRGVAGVWNVSDGRLIATMVSHDGPILSARFSPDSQRLLTTSSDRTARVWDVATGHEIAALIGHTGAVLEGAFSARGEQVVTASADGFIRVWGIQRTIAGRAGNRLSVQPRTEALRTAVDVGSPPDPIARTWALGEDDAAALSILQKNLSRHSIGQIAVSRDGGKYLSVDGSQAEILDTRGGVPRRFSFSEGPPNALEFSPDGKTVLAAGPGKFAIVYDIQQGKVSTLLAGHDADVVFAAFSPDGSQIVTASKDRTARVWRVRDGSQRLALVGHSDGVEIAEFSPDGQRVLTAGGDGAVRLWNASNGSEIVTLRSEGSTILRATFAPDGDRVITASAGKAQIWDTTSGRIIASILDLPFKIERLAFSRDGKTLYVVSGERSGLAIDISRFVDSMGDLAAAACTSFLTPTGRRFASLEVSADPLLRDVWLPDTRRRGDLCDLFPASSKR